MQAVYVPADDPTDPAPANTFQHLDAFIYLERSISEKGIYPAIDPLASNSRLLDAQYIGEKHFNVARRVQQILQRSRELQDIIAILGIDELSEEDEQNVNRAGRIERFSVAAFLCGGSLHRVPGLHLARRHDSQFSKKSATASGIDLPESAFTYVGTIEEAEAKAKKMAAEAKTLFFKRY